MCILHPTAFTVLLLQSEYRYSLKKFALCFQLKRFRTLNFVRIQNKMRDSESLESNLEKLHYGKFPEDFKFGTLTIAHQIEGNWKGDGKGCSMWDEFARSHPERIVDHSTADEACDSYHKFEADVFLLKLMNATSYMFSLNWSRILPDGTTNSVNQQGIEYYDKLINTLIENGIEPIVTLSHNDIPNELLKRNKGGWTDPLLIEEFVSYANLCFDKFGNRVQCWITTTQSWTNSIKSYETGVHPPYLALGQSGAFRAHKNLLQAHAKVYRLYENLFREEQGGKVAISIRCRDDHEENFDIQLGRELYPLVYGEYPAKILSTFGQKDFSEEEKREIKGSFDFIVLDFYPETLTTSSFSTIFSQKILNESLEMLSILLNSIKLDYGNPEVLLTFAGPPSERSNETLMDIERAQYFNKVANQILKAIDLDGCNVRGYFPGKLMDCWEQDSGYSISHGLYYVDFSNPSKKRSPRASVAFMLKQLFKEKKFQPLLPF